MDLTDLDEFEPIDGLALPTQPLYLVSGVDRGDDLLNWSPDEALPELALRGRRPLTVNEGISWLLFNLKEDPYEQVNLAHNAKYRAERGKLLSRLRQWVADTGDKFPLPQD